MRKAFSKVFVSFRGAARLRKPARRCDWTVNICTMLRGIMLRWVTTAEMTFCGVSNLSNVRVLQKHVHCGESVRYSIAKGLLEICFI